MTVEKQERARSVFEHHGPVVKTQILRENKLFGRDVVELVSIGLIRKVKTGYYVWAATQSKMTDLELAASVVSRGIICLQSAASYYDLTTLIPTAITIAIPSNSMRPVLPTHPPIELVLMPAALFELGLVEETDEYGKLRIYNKERTVCDFFRKRHTIGEDLAIEVLKGYMAGKRNLQLLLEYAGKLRIKSVIKPYVEALL